MADFNGIPPFSSPPGLPPGIDGGKTAIPPVEPGTDTRATGERHTPDPHIGRTARLSDFDEATLPGPPPAFRANVLEIDSSLRNQIARLEAARGLAEAEIATGGAVPGESD